MDDQHKVWPGRRAVALLHGGIEIDALLKRSQELVALAVQRDLNNRRKPMAGDVGQFVGAQQRDFTFNQPRVAQALDAPQASGR